MINKTVRLLYNSLDHYNLRKNPFIPCKRYWHLCRTVLRYVPKAQQDAVIKELDTFNSICRKNAFELGFYTALRLFMKF